MKKYLPYIVLLALLGFALVTLASHFQRLPELVEYSFQSHRISFRVDGDVTFVTPEAAEAGLRVGDRLITINGRSEPDRAIWVSELRKQVQGESLALTVERDGNRTDLVIPPSVNVKDFAFFARFVVGMLVSYFLPVFCITLGFWVVFVRVGDPLAWILLFLLLGLSSIGFEGSGTNSLTAIYTQIFFSVWAASMLLFGIYFPERLELDRRLPWLKWILLVPLAVQLLRTLAVIAGLGAFVKLPETVDRIVGTVVFPVNLLSIGLFFAALGYKAGTIKNPDSRRRLRLMAVGTSIAMMPSFIIIIYRVVTKASGSFFDVVPFWFALIALLALLLFPLTLAYVIVVNRAMDVGVVIRQGLQYALAQNGVKVLQFLMMLGVVLGVIWIVRMDQSFSVGAQIGFVAAGFALVPVIDWSARNLRTWIDRRFFREAYDAERILADLSGEVQTMVETQPLLEMVAEKISKSLHVPQIALLLDAGGTIRPAHALGYDSFPNVEFDRNGQMIARLRSNETITIYDENQESSARHGIDDTEREKLRTLNSQLVLPLGAKNGLSGLISLSPKRSEEPFTPNDLRLLRSVAAQTGLALENSRLTETIAREAAQKERLNRELEIAREVQERLFPQEFPSVSGLDFYGACRPALGVGGDYYDFLEVSGGQLGIAIGDISGKGIGASLMMASLQASLRGQTIHFGDDLAEMMKHVNTLLYEASTTNRYATFFYGQYDPATGRFIYVNAGHNPPFLIRAGGTVEKLDAGGPVVGMLPSLFVNYEQGEVRLEPGDVLVGFTDGISEAMNNDDEEWGEEAMLAELIKLTQRPASEILENIVACADRFADGAKQHDDMTMIVVRKL